MCMGRGGKKMTAKLPTVSKYSWVGLGSTCAFLGSWPAPAMHSLPPTHTPPHQAICYEFKGQKKVRAAADAERRDGRPFTRLFHQASSLLLNNHDTHPTTSLFPFPSYTIQAEGFFQGLLVTKVFTTHVAFSVEEQQEKKTEAKVGGWVGG